MASEMVKRKLHGSLEMLVNAAFPFVCKWNYFVKECRISCWRQHSATCCPDITDCITARRSCIQNSRRIISIRRCNKIKLRLQQLHFYKNSSNIWECVRSLQNRFCASYHINQHKIFIRTNYNVSCYQKPKWHLSDHNNDNINKTDMFATRYRKWFLSTTLIYTLPQ